ncbi:MAG: metal-dependent hydrolase [Nanoarchaeota archaeon]
MPNAATHVIVAMVVAGIIRDFIIKKRFSSAYILIAGIAGLMPDLDIVLYWFLNLIATVPVISVHRWLSHSLLVPLTFLAIALVYSKLKKKKAMLVFLMIALGTMVHIILDYLLAGYIRPFYPISAAQHGLNLIPNTELGGTIALGLDAILLCLWLMWEYWQRNIKEYI